MSKEVVIPWELKYKFVRGMLTTLFKGFMYEIREKFGAAAALEIHESLNKRDDRIKNMTHTLKNVFKIGGNDCETIAKWFDIYMDILEVDATWFERSKTIARLKVIKCAWKTGFQDISNWSFNFFNIVAETINPKVIFERPKAMCAGDPHCEYVYKIEE